MEAARDARIGWLREPWWLHGAALLLLAVGGFLRFGWWLSFPGPLLPDELTYSRAIQLVLDGESPYDWGGYLYPPLFALGCAWIWETLGRGGLLAVLRVVNLAGAVVTVWCAVVWLPWAWRWRVATGLGVVILSPAMVQGLTFGNVSLWVSGMLVLALLLWRRHPVTSGLLMGVSLAIKPLAPPAILVLAAHRPRESEQDRSVGPRFGPGWAAGIAAAVAVGVAAALTVPLPHFFEWLELGSSASPQRSVSFHRFPAIFGFEPHLLIVTALVMVGVLLLARWRRWGRLGVLGLSLVAVMAATPLVWSHTLVATLPLQALALCVLSYRWRAARAEGTGLPRYEPILVGLGVAALHLATGANTIYTTPWWLQVLGAGAPALAPGALLAYVVAGREGLPETWRREI